jgi:NADH:ubiquinone reductase (H+-translocating)
MPSVVIIGSGFAGMVAAKHLLAKSPKGTSITLISKSDCFTFKPLLHEFATGAFNSSIVCERVSPLLNPKAQFIEGTASAINLKKQSISVGTQSIRYDYLLLALGSTPGMAAIPGAEKHALRLDSAQDAIRIRSALIAASKKHCPSVLLIGAGPVGIELASEIAQYLNQLCGKGTASVTLLNSDGELLPNLSPRFRHRVHRFLRAAGVRILNGHRVVRLHKCKAILDNHSAIMADIIIWSGGVKPVSIKTTPNLKQERGIPVNSFLQHNTYNNVFAAGDCAGMAGVPWLAQAAVQEGRAAAENIVRSMRHKPLRPFTYRQRGFILPIGKGHAVATVFGITFSGFFAWWFNRTVYLMHMLTLRHKVYVSREWTLGLFRKRDGPSEKG